MWNLLDSANGEKGERGETMNIKFEKRSMRDSSARNTARQRAGAAIGAIVLCLAGAAVGQNAPSPTGQDIQDRLLGTPNTASQAAPDCSTQQALENNPDCGQTVRGGERGFSLFKNGAQTAPAPSGRASVATSEGPAKHVRAPRRTTGAASCGVEDAASAKSVNLCVTFALNSSVLTDKSKQSLGQLVAALNSPQIAGRNAIIEGYADASGNPDANLKLSDARARAVVDYLADHGVARTRLDAKGYGATHFLPGRSSDDPGNRRVEARLKE